MADQFSGPVPGNNAFDVNQIFGKLVSSPQTAMALAIITILGMLIVPLPTWLLDVTLVISISFAVMILMTVLFIGKPLEFSSFPTVLLVATLLRLALNLSSTRLILSHGNEGPDAAGHVIEAFANFVMSGNFVIGVIVFAILTIVNFVVITKGSGRIAEVAARFTLDAMPGKQMAIDADLSSGLIEEGVARARRKELEAESSFHGSMDGAAKFVRGDAVAGLIITFINIIAGIVIGVAQKGLSFSQAADFYIRLTVGDGLVTQVPALIVSVASGLLVTKSIDPGAGEGKSTSLFAQMGNYPNALYLTSGMMGVFAFLPGMPFIPFALLSGGTGYLGYNISQTQDRQVVEEARVAAAKAIAPPVAEEPISKSLSIDTIRIEIGYGLISLANSENSTRLTDQLKGLRKQMAGELGFVMPEIRIQDNLQLPPNTYVIRIKEIEAGRGELRPNQLLVMDPRGEYVSLPGEKTTEPAFGLPAMWVDQTYREEALFKGCTVVDPPAVITTHLTELVKEHMPDMLSYTETQKLLDEMGKDKQKLVADLIPAQITVGTLQNILRKLLSERVSIRDLPTILEGIAEAAPHTRNQMVIIEHVRARLARQISNQYATDGGFIPLVTLSPDWEQAFSQAIVGEGDERQLALPPSELQQFTQALRTTFERFAQMGEAPVLMTSARVRPYVRSIVERFRPQTAVLSHNEIHPKAKIKTLGQV